MTFRKTDPEDLMLPREIAGCSVPNCDGKHRSLGLCQLHYGRRRRDLAPPCNQPGCAKPRSSRGMCAMHHKRFRLYGDPNATPRFTRDHSVRFWAGVGVGHPAGCWWWEGRRNNNGYGTFQIGSGAARTARTLIAHRYAYELLIGRIPDGMQIDHLCRNRACVNPDHLEPVTPGENTRRGSAARKTHCNYGHRFTPANTYRQPSNGRRSCLTCRRLRSHGLDVAA